MSTYKLKSNYRIFLGISKSSTGFEQKVNSITLTYLLQFRIESFTKSIFFSAEQNSGTLQKMIIFRKF